MGFDVVRIRISLFLVTGLLTAAAVAYAVTFEADLQIDKTPDSVQQTVISTNGPQTGSFEWSGTVRKEIDQPRLLMSELEYHEVSKIRSGKSKIEHTFTWLVNGEIWHSWQHTTIVSTAPDARLEVITKEARGTFGPRSTRDAFVHIDTQPLDLQVIWSWKLTLEEQPANAEVEIDFSPLNIWYDKSTPSAICHTYVCATMIAGSASITFIASAAWWYFGRKNK